MVYRNARPTGDDKDEDMRELHAGVLAIQGIPIILLIVLAAWIAYYMRALYIEIRTIRKTMESLIVRYEDEAPAPPSQQKAP